jgi:hypothetical protein
MKFQSEEARQEAIDKIDELDPNAATLLEQYSSAEIGEEEPSKTPNPATAVENKKTEIPGGEIPSEEKVSDPEKKDDAAAPEEPKQHVITDLKGFKTPEELLKSFENAQEMITRQAEKITKLEGRTGADQELKDRLDKAERELAQLRKSGEGKQATETKVDIQKLNSDRESIKSVLDELDRQAEEDPDIVFTAEYNKKKNAAMRMIVENSESYNQVFAQLSSDLAETKSSYSEIVNGRKRQDEEQKQKELITSVFNEMDAIDDPEYKTETPSSKLADQYLDWRSKVAAAFYGRPARNEEEQIKAINQLEMRNQKLIQDCQMRQIATEPTDEMKKYLAKCEANLYRQGYRKNANGVFSSDKRVMVVNDDGVEVPYIMKSIKEAIEQMRLESGYYQKQADDSFQRGASSFAAAAGQRDRGALTLDAGPDTGKSTHDVEWATNILNNADEYSVAAAIRSGDTSALSEINEARKILGMEPMSV